MENWLIWFIICCLCDVYVVINCCLDYVWFGGNNLGGFFIFGIDCDGKFKVDIIFFVVYFELIGIVICWVIYFVVILLL